MKMYKDLQEATAEVLLIQDACNSRAIIRIFPAVMMAIEKYDPQKSTDDYNSHPLVVLMLDKLAQLAKGFVNWSGEASVEGGAVGFGHAYRWAADVQEFGSSGNDNDSTY